MQQFIQQLINGIALGGLYALTAIGYSLVYGVMELVNFSHGAVYMLGAYIFYILFEICGAPLWLSVPGALIAAGITGLVIQKVALTPFARKHLPLVYSLIATIGLSIVIQNAMLLIMGSETRYTYIYLADFRISVLTLFIIGLSIALITALSLFLKLTRLGAGDARYRSEPVRRNANGHTRRAHSGAMLFCGRRTGGGRRILSSMNYRSVDISIGTSMGVKAFAATVLGGIGSVGGAALGGLIIGISEVLVAGYISASLRDMAAYIILIAILIIRPSGLMGARAQRRVCEHDQISQVRTHGAQALEHAVPAPRAGCGAGGADNTAGEPGRIPHCAWQ